MGEEKSVLREVDQEALRLARTLLRTSRSGALAALDPASGAPAVSRVGVCTDFDGTPVLLGSALALHTRALLADGRCSLLLGEAGKGDPLAHPRISIECLAAEVSRDGDEHVRLRTRYLSHQPKARLYIDLPDFRFFRLEPMRASLNGGFGKAYALEPGHLLSRTEVTWAIAAREAGAVEHMNEDHFDAIDHYARFYLKAPQGNWALAGVEEDGMTIFLGDDIRRLFFETLLTAPEDMHQTLVKMARTARAGLEGADSARSA